MVAAVAKLFARKGAALALLDRNTDELEETAEATGSSCFAVDIVDESSVASVTEKAAEALEASTDSSTAPGSCSAERQPTSPRTPWRRVLEVNLTGTYIVSRACLPWLDREPQATIVNIASAQGLLPNAPGYTAYAASKGGVINLTRVLAAELAPRIRVNSVCPGMVDTSMADGYRDNAGEHYALKRLAEPAEIAQAILFLTSVDSSYVTGAAIAVDGGRTFH